MSYISYMSYMSSIVTKPAAESAYVTHVTIQLCNFTSQ